MSTSGGNSHGRVKRSRFCDVVNIIHRNSQDDPNLQIADYIAGALHGWWFPQIPEGARESSTDSPNIFRCFGSERSLRENRWRSDEEYQGAT